MAGGSENPLDGMSFWSWFQKGEIAFELDCADVFGQIELFAGRGGEIDRIEMEFDDLEQLQLEAAHVAFHCRVRRSAADRRRDGDVELQVLRCIRRGESEAGDAGGVRPGLYIGLPGQRRDNLVGQPGRQQLRRLFRRAGDVQDLLDDCR
jgi:hypothetical protein